MVRNLRQDYADMHGWEELPRKAAKIYHSLTPEQQKTCLLFASHYGQAGVMNFYRKQYGLPETYCFNASFVAWAKEDMEITCQIDIDDNTQGASESFYSSVLVDREKLRKFEQWCARNKVDSTKVIENIIDTCLNNDDFIVSLLLDENKQLTLAQHIQVIVDSSLQPFVDRIDKLESQIQNNSKTIVSQNKSSSVKIQSTTPKKKTNFVSHKEANKTYEHDSSWKKDDCTSCMCQNGEISCAIVDCPVVLCKNPVKKPGQCCPTCLKEECYDAASKRTYKNSK